MSIRHMIVAGMGVLALVTAGCGSGGAPSAPAGAAPPDAAKPVKIAFVTKFPVAFFTAMEDSAKAFAKDHPGTVDITYFSCKSPTDVTCQTAQIQDAVARGFQALVITPMGPEVIPAMDAAAAKGLKVVLVDNDLADFTKKAAVVATDNVKGGKAAGEYLKSVLKPGDTIGLMEGVRAAPALAARIEGVENALKDTGVTVIKGGAETECDSAQGATVAQDLLTRAPNLTAIYSACDDPALAAATVVKQKGKQVLVMGYDGLPDAAKAIQAGQMKATIAQFPGKMAARGVEAAANAVQGKPVDAFIDTGTQLVTTDNAGTFLTFQ
jgi:ABC-type sugar transport system substrate-binding protein